MPTKGPSSPTNAVDDVCHSTNDDDNNTNVLDNSDEAELSTVDESVNNDEPCHEESATNNGNDGGTSYQEVTTVDADNNDAVVEQQQQAVGVQDEDNSNEANVVGGESQAQVADEQRITSTSSGTSIDDESTQSSSQTVTEGNDQAVLDDQADINQLDNNQLMKMMSNMLQNNAGNTARLAEIMAILLIRFNKLSMENAEMREIVQQKLQSPDFEEVLARIKAVESDNEKLKKQTKKHFKAIKKGQKDHASLRAKFNTLKEQVEKMRHRVSKEQVREEYNVSFYPILSAFLTYYDLLLLSAEY